MKLDDLKSGAKAAGDCGNPDDVPPVWLDRERFFRGQAFFQRHIVPLTLAMHCSLACGLAVPNLLDALVFTEQSDTPKKSLKRYLTTFYYLMQWHTGDLWDDPGCKGFKSIRTVRGLHKAVFNEMNSHHEGTNSLYMSQYDMALVQCGFMGAMTMYPSGFGVKYTQNDLQDYVHFWRGVGYLLGVSDNFNICSGNYVETYKICKEIEMSILLPNMNSPPEEFNKMSKAYCDGVNLFLHIPAYSIEGIFAFVYDIMGLPVPKLNWQDWLRFWSLKTFVFCIRWVPMFEWILNYLVMRTFNKFISASEKKAS